MALVVCAVELMSFFSIAILKAKDARAFYQDHVEIARSVTPKELQAFQAKTYDAELGWKNRPNSDRHITTLAGLDTVANYDSNAARRVPVPFSADLIYVYGDSFTHCDEVNDDETWPYYLSMLTQSAVRNHGEGGYGTDQALMRFLKTAPQDGKPRISILAIYEDDINRIVNVYRPFFWPSSGMMFKPRYFLRDGKLKYFPNPLRPNHAAEDILGLVEQIRHLDYWNEVNEYKRVRVAFPFTFTVAKYARHLYRERTGIRHQTWLDLPTRNLMFAIVEEFRRASKKLNFVPLVLFIPEVSNLARGGPDYASFVKELRGRYASNRLIVEDISQHDFDRQKFNVVPYQGHASPYGNKIIASALFESMRRSPNARKVLLQNGSKNARASAF